MLNLHLLECTLKGYDHISDLLLAKYWVITGCKYCKCTSLKSVTIPDSVTKIGEKAFYRCTSLESVTIPDSVTSIGEWAFYDCSGELIINSKIIETDYSYDNYPIIDSSSWLYKARFSKLTIGDSITKIGDSAFQECSSLTSVTIGNGVTEIGDYTFYNCTSLTSVTIPDSVTSIGEEAFYRCNSLTSVTIGNSVTSIGYRAFRYCDSLTRVDITDIEAWCKISFVDGISNPLYYAHNLYLNGELVTDLVIPDSVTSIEAGAFIGCNKLTSVTIPDSVTKIGGRAFEYCI